MRIFDNLKEVKIIHLCKMAAVHTALHPFKRCLSSVRSTACKLLHAGARTTYSKFSTLHHTPSLSSSAGYHGSASAAEKLNFDNQPVSWLFVSDAVAGAYGAQVNLELDLDNRLSGENLKQLQLNVNSRGLTLDLNKLVVDFATLRLLEKQRNDLLTEKNEIIKQLKVKKEECQGSDQDFENTAQDLTLKLTSIKQKLKDMKAFWNVEEDVMLRCLQLPNDLHTETPLQESAVLRESNILKADSVPKICHTTIAKNHDLIKFSNVGPKAYYLKNALAKLEMDLSTKVINYFQAHKFYFIAAPEFFKTPIIEGCGLDVRDPTQVLTMLDATDGDTEPMNHLAGISPATFVAYVARCCIGDKALPLNMFACGRSYQNNHLPGLYGANQSIQLGTFSCVLPEDLNKQFDKTVELIWNLLTRLGFPLRLSQVRAKDLKLAERRRVEVQIYAPSLQQYVPIAHVSDLSDFVSRRLMVRHNLNHADYRFAPLVHMVSGTGVNITTLLAAWLEYSYTDKDKLNLLPLPTL
ncbi:hypothetical protein Btru_057809 [Bulinus truncatus]|nr:hypothetical protein Btru_057809 [Bulinus truncatus]